MICLLFYKMHVYKKTNKHFLQLTRTNFIVVCLLFHESENNDCLVDFCMVHLYASLPLIFFAHAKNILSSTKKPFSRQNITHLKFTYVQNHMALCKHYVGSFFHIFCIKILVTMRNTQKAEKHRCKIFDKEVR